ncbi:MAG: hypothetical protein ACRDMV_16345 [Streptosporangiales bacterium]
MVPGWLDLLARQAWQPAIEEGRLRVHLGGDVPAGWRPLEAYRVLPSAGKARLLVPYGPASLTAAALLAYRRMHGKRRARMGRLAVGMAARSGLPVSRDVLQVLVRDSAAAPRATETPVSYLAGLLGHHRLYASLGVVGSHAKLTWRLLDGHGRGLGFAKMGWNAATERSVAAERTALQALAGGHDSLRAPALLADGGWHGHGLAVSAPLPPEARSPHPGGPPPEPTALARLLPIARRDRLSASAHVQRLLDAAAALPAPHGAAELPAMASSLVAAVTETDPRMLIATRWHGDLVPWNTARVGSATWLWDWEFSATDVPAGLDHLHWAVHTALNRGRPFAAATAEELETAQPYLAAFGASRQQARVLVCVYALEMLVRTWRGVLGGAGWPAHLRLAHLADLTRVALHTARSDREYEGRVNGR